MNFQQDVVSSTKNMDKGSEEQRAMASKCRAFNETRNVAAWLLS